MNSKSGSNPVVDLKNANALLAQQKCPEAIQAYQKFLAEYPKDAGAYNLLGLAYLCINQPEVGVQNFNQALALSPTFSDVHNNLGVAYMTMKQYPEAEQEFKKALADPNYAASGPYFNLAKLAYQRESYEESRALAKKSMMLNPKEASPHLLYALSLEKLGRVDEAVNSYKELLRLAPNSMEGLYYLGVLYLKQGRACEARDLLTKVVDADPLGELGQKAIESLKTIHCVPPPATP